MGELAERGGLDSERRGEQQGPNQHRRCCILGRLRPEPYPEGKVR